MTAAKTVMVQGTASSVGKSFLVTALCRIFHQGGWSVAPFKAQNMSLNSSVTLDGGEIGRAQAVQAEAAGIEPTVDMNPILLKPEADNVSQVVIRGKPFRSVEAQNYFCLKESLWKVVTESLDRLLSQHDVVVIEGAGSPAEINLRDKDFVNMRVACHVKAPVLLTGDIDRGGVFASLVGTLELLQSEERELIKGFIINKFRGDPSLLVSGLTWLTAKTGIAIAGVVPYFQDIQIAEEDSVSVQRRQALKIHRGEQLKIAVIALPHLSNFDDFDPLQQERDVQLYYVEPGDPLENPDLIILPGTKSTMADLNWLRRSGRAREIVKRAQTGTAVIGICGGFQMLGHSILDPDYIESKRAAAATGLGLLPVETTFYPCKSTHRVKGRVLADEGLLRGAGGLSITGFEIHMAQTPVDPTDAVFHIKERSNRRCRIWDGCLSPDGNIFGTYLHGLFHNDLLRRAILRELAGRKGERLRFSRVQSNEEEYDRLARLTQDALNMDFVHKIMELEPRKARSK